MPASCPPTKAADIAGAAVFLAAPAGRWMTGQAMIIDGGMLISLGEL